jgi:two-component system, sensor histidine kinase ChiS
MKKNSSLAQDFTVFSAIIILAVLLISLGVGLIIHHSYYDRQESRIADKANFLDLELTESLSFTAHYARFLGDKISQNAHKTPYIKQILSTELPSANDSSHIWTVFNWITPSKKLIPNTSPNDRLEENELSSRPLLDRTPLYPGKVQFSSPTIGSSSHEWIIPIGVGITNNKEEFLGTIHTGISLDLLSNKLEKIFKRKDLVFMLFDDDFNFIASSSNLKFSYTNALPPESLIARLRSKVFYAHADNGFFSKKSEYLDFNFTYFKHSDKYPFYFVIGENIKISNAEYWQITFPRIAELTLMGALFIILLYYFRRHIVQPILSLAGTARKIAAGEANINVEYEQYEEVKLLATQLKEIHDTKKELIQAKNDVDLINKNLEHKVKTRTSDLEKALTIKTEFLNNISHEVRTPVQGITTISKGLVEHWHSHTEEKKLALASAVANNSQRLFSLVSNLLDLSIFNSGRMVFNLQKSNLIELIDNIITECETLYLLEKDIKIIFPDHPKKAELSIDSEKVSQVFRNLLTNSIKFMSKGIISIKISTIENKDLKTRSSSSKAYLITIEDEGTSIPESDLEEIFSPFIQSGEIKAQVSGAGLGLSICKNIITGHNGKIWANNNKNGKGVNISFTLPILTATSRTQIAAPETQLSYVRSGNILMIDDEPTCQMSMDILLSNTGYNLISQYGGISGLAYLEKNPDYIDLILLDLMMPDMYGLNVLTELKANPKLCHIPVVIQSGTNDNKEIERTLSLGAETYVRKPYQRQQILDVIDTTLNN